MESQTPERRCGSSIWCRDGAAGASSGHRLSLPVPVAANDDARLNAQASDRGAEAADNGLPLIGREDDLTEAAKLLVQCFVLLGA